jgi:hypothetical protein
MYEPAAAVIVRCSADYPSLSSRFRRVGQRSGMSPERLEREGRRVLKPSCERLFVRPQRSGLEGSSPFRLRRYHAQLRGWTEPEAAVVLRRAEQNDQGHVRGINSGEKPVHQSAPDASALMIRKDANRPYGNNWVGGDGRLARRNVADHAALAECREREFGNGLLASHSASNTPTSGAREPGFCGFRKRGRLKASA